MLGELTGTVTAFDAERGLGTIESSAGRTFAFHCVEIADGTREIAVGTAVSFGSLPKLGRYEAANIRPDR